MTAKPPFHGVRIIDLSTTIAGPLAATILADQGADVIKVEEPTLGDRLRYQGSSKNGISNVFHMANRGKRSIALDLKKPEGIAVLKQLAATADVFMHNTRPGVMERLGVGYEQIRAVKEDIVYVAISGFGDEGPLAQAAAYDPVIQSFTGFASLQAGNGDASLVRNLVCDKITALNAAQAISAALYARKNGQGGQLVRLSMIGAAAHFLWVEMAKTQALLDQDVKVAPTPAETCRLYRFADGWGNVTPASDGAFVNMCRAFEVKEIEDERLHTFVGRMSHPDLTAGAMAAWERAAAKMPLKEAMARLEAADVPCAPVMSMDEFAAHPHVVETGIFAETQHPLAGRIREARPPAKFSKTPARIGGPTPALGQDTESVLAEIGADAAKLRAAKVVK
jgi:crotonobetainyl-CoA:carnitine CoA-transferase CaiB-like acyl-CoA transferase